ncbi:MAG: 16S rRNA (guanine(966)-N(2))-methyltransferase RsmD [SAR324 cluster bacterium]|nr:16S rRNA (guanine(966)-N(2))-methyltransferase RsmD [SAR324 cluster bacterium]
MITIIGGKFRGKKIKVPQRDEVRPTLNKTREAAFNVLQNLVIFPKMTALDLYAGSGAMGLEALSRGVLQSFFVEKSPKVFQVLQKNINSFSFEKGQAVAACRTASRWLNQASINEALYLIFIDPPYQSQEYEKILSRISEIPEILQNSMMVVESPIAHQFSLQNNLERIQSKQYGQTKLDFLVKC